MSNYIQKLLRIFSANPQQKETVEEVHRWLIDDSIHAEEKESALREIWDNTKNVVVPQTWQSLAEVYWKIDQSNGNRKRKFSLRSVWKYAAAITVLFVSILGTYLITKDTTPDLNLTEYFTSIGDRGVLTLPDGSQVMTNSTTLLIYPKTFTHDTRTVYLMGEANFKVHKDPEKPFIVKSDRLAITALGTQFNVASYPDDSSICATLIEGSIKVECIEDGENYMLVPGEQLVYDKAIRKSLVSKANMDDVTAWQRDELVFKSMEIEDILKMLERKYEVTFQYNTSTFNHDKYNFRFKSKAPLTEIMDIVQTVVGTFDYTLKGKICYLKLKT